MKRSWISWASVLVLSLMLLTAVGCSDDTTAPEVNKTDVTATVMAAGDQYFDDYTVTFNGVTSGVNVPPDSFFTHYQDYYVVDLRSSADFANSHVVGAHNMALSSLVDELDSMPTDKVILFICYSGQTASYATSIVNLIGTETGHVAKNLKFGASELMPLEAVKADGTFSYPMLNDLALDMVTTPSPAKGTPGGYPVMETDSGKSKVEILKDRARAAIAAWGDGTAKITHTAANAASMDDLYLINYFTESNYLDGHLPNAIQYTPGTMITSEALNTLPTDKDIAIYCYTGQTSAQLTAYLQMAGYSVKSILYGVQKMAYGDDAINDAPWHESTTDYSSILEGTYF